MSYILEALKKAEAERRLGATPTIHAGALDGAVVPASAAARRPLVAAVAVMALVIAGLAAIVWRQADDDAAPVAAKAVAAAPVAVAPVKVAPAAGAPVPVLPPAPVVAAKAPDPVPPPKSAVVAAPAPSPAVAPTIVPKTEPAPAREPDDAAIQSLRDLPEPIRRAIPTYSMDGYMYSSNPADRLILIDKVLRREGEEVAPGLVLEKLLPKGAVFTFRGYRYRVAF